MSDTISGQFSPHEEASLPRKQTRSDLNKSCEDFLKLKLAEIANAPYSDDEKRSLAALVKMGVEPLKHKSPEEILKEFTKIDFKLTVYERIFKIVSIKIEILAKSKMSVQERTALSEKLREGAVAILTDLRDDHYENEENEIELAKTVRSMVKSVIKGEEPIKRSPMMATKELAELVQKRATDRQLDPKAEQLSSQHAERFLSSTMRMHLQPETQLLISKLLQDRLISLRARYRQNSIDLTAFEAGLKKIHHGLNPLHKAFKELREEKESLRLEVQKIPEGLVLRSQLVSYVEKNLPEIEVVTSPKALLERLQVLHNVVSKACQFVAGREEWFNSYESDLLKKIRKSPLDKEEQNRLIQIYNNGINRLIDLIKKETPTAELEAFLASHASSITSQLTEE